jgi:hypothetical protein
VSVKEMKKSTNETTCSPAHAGSSLADFPTLKWRRYIPPKHWFTQDLHGAKSQKTAFSTLTLFYVTNIAKISFLKS